MSTIFSHLVNLVLLGLALLCLGLGVYVGAWEWFIGGIIDVVEAVKMDDVPAGMVAIGIAKVVFFEIPIIIGWVLMLMFLQAIK